MDFLYVRTHYQRVSPLPIHPSVRSYYHDRTNGRSNPNMRNPLFRYPRNLREGLLHFIENMKFAMTAMCFSFFLLCAFAAWQGDGVHLRGGFHLIAGGGFPIGRTRFPFIILKSLIDIGYSFFLCGWRRRDESRLYMGGFPIAVRLRM